MQPAGGGIEPTVTESQRGTGMSIIRVGSNGTYAEGWDAVFSKSKPGKAKTTKAKAGKVKAAKAKPAAKKTAKKAAAKNTTGTKKKAGKKAGKKR
jgi:hypothetical protein